MQWGRANSGTIAEMFDDLQQLFGYRGAIDERRGVVEVGPDLLVVPCWTPQFCATVVRAAEALGAFEQQPDDPVPGHEVSLAIISPRLFERCRKTRAALAAAAVRGRSSNTTAPPLPCLTYPYPAR